MPRIRNLKPEFWDSPDTARADLAVRLLYQAMWNWADDSGRGTANLKELEAFAFPNDDVRELPRKPTRRNSATVWPNFGSIVAEVQRCYGVVFYKVRGRPYYWIPSFKANQSKHFNPDSKLPSPDDGEIWDLTSEYGFPEEGSARSSATQAPNFGGYPPESAGLGPLDRDRDRDRDRDISAAVESVTTDRARETSEQQPTGRPVPSDGWKLIRDEIETTLPQAVKTSLAIEAATLLHAGTPEALVREALRLWNNKPGLGPKILPHLVSDIQRSRDAPAHGKATEKALGWIEAGKQDTPESEFPELPA